MKLGTIAGRHPMPVDMYLLEGSVEPGNPAYEAAFLAAVRWRRAYPKEYVALYYSGLTEVTLGVLDGLYYAGGSGPDLYRWDTDTGAYERLWRRPPRELDFDGWGPEPGRSPQQIRDDIDDAHSRVFR